MATTGDPAADAAADAARAAWIEKLQGAVAAASAEARGAFFYYAGFGLYFAVAVAGTSHEDLLRGATVAMPGLGIGMPVVGFYSVVPALFVVFHVYVLLQLMVLARRIGWLTVALQRRGGPAAYRQRLLVSPFAVTQRLIGEPRGPVPQILLRLSIWLTLVLIPLGLLLATQMRFLPYHSSGVTWAHRIYIALDALLVLLLWPAIIHPEQRGALAWLGALSGRIAARRRSALAGVRAAGEALRRRLVGPRRREQRAWGSLGAVTRGALALLVLFGAFVVATVPGEGIETALLSADQDDEVTGCAAPWRVDRWLATVRLPDRRTVLCVTYALFEAPETPLGLRRNIIVTDADLVQTEPTQALIDELGAREAWRSKGKGINLQGRDLRFADLSDSDLRRADLRGANLQGALLQRANLTAALAGSIPRADLGDCVYRSDAADSNCLTGLVDADLTTADLRLLEGYKIELQGADLTGVRLEDAQLEHGRLDGAILTWARLDRAWLDGANLNGAVLREVVAPQVRLNQADLTYAFLRQADLADASLAGVLVKGADLGGIEVAEPSRWPDEPIVPVEIELTADLFGRACPPPAGSVDEEVAGWAAQGVVQRLWHEFDYSKSHDPDGYARVADLRYLLARLMLDRDACPSAAAIPGRDVCRLQRFVTQWTDWRRRRAALYDKPIEPDLESTWADLRKRIGISTEARAGAGSQVADIWQQLDAELPPERCCPGSAAAGDDPSSNEACAATAACAC